MDPFVHNVTWWYLVIGFCIGVGILILESLESPSWLAIPRGDDPLSMTFRIIIQILLVLWVADLVFWVGVGLVSWIRLSTG